MPVVILVVTFAVGGFVLTGLVEVGFILYLDHRRVKSESRVDARREPAAVLQLHGWPAESWPAESWPAW